MIRDEFINRKIIPDEKDLDFARQNELYLEYLHPPVMRGGISAFECRICSKPYVDRPSLYEHYVGHDNDITELSAEEMSKLQP